MANKSPGALEVAPGLALPADAVTQSFALLAVRRAGKALALDTKLPTPGGWTTMGAVERGDKLFAEDGKVCTVTDAWPVRYDRPCYEVTFSDDTKVTADAEHQWLAENSAARRAANRDHPMAPPRLESKRAGRWQNERRAWPEILTTEQLAAQMADSPRGFRNTYSVRVAAPLQCPDADLPVPPYTLGAWLGDGATATGSVTSADPDIIAEIEAEGETTWVIPSTVKEHHASYRVQGLQPRLRVAGVLGAKHIPEVYFRASERQRRALLAGLLDTDGYCSKRGAAEFCSSRERLARDVHHLIATLGYKPSLRSKVARLNGKDCGTAWTVGFTPSDKVFRLPRKVARQAMGRHLWAEHRYVVDVSPVPSVPVRCIAVDSPSHLYLAGESCIPTHNSNAAAVIAEEMHAAGLPWVAIDPKGDWWGLRSSRDGTGPGLPVPVFGGLHGDVPLTPEAGRLIAEIIAEENLTCILDVSDFPSKAAQMRFLTDFAEHLFRLHRKHPHPRHVFLEEADEYLPQRVMGEQAKCVGAWSRLVKQGGAFGLGVTLISQRSAVVNKDALTQVETLIALRTTSPQDRAAIKAWVDYHDAGRELVDSLPGLEDGEAWVVSPHWLARHGQPAIQRVRFRQRATFDSGATPTMASASQRPANLADIDLGAILTRMETAAETVADDGTAALRRRVVHLERELAEARSRPPEHVEVPAVAPGEIAALEQIVTGLRDAAGSIELALSRVTAPARVAPAVPKPAPRPASTPRPVAEVPAASGDMTLSKAQRAILTVLAQFPEGRTKRQLGMLAGYSSKGGGFNNALSSLRSASLISRGEPVTATAEGIAALGGEWAPLPEGPELAAHWLAQLSRAEGLVLRALLEAWPGSLTKTEVAERTGYAADGGGFNNALSRLRTLQLIDGRGELRADETLAAQATIKAGQ
jgi:hypothetical protein